MEFNLMGLIPLIFIIWIGIVFYKLSKYILQGKTKKISKTLGWLSLPVILVIIWANFSPVKLTEHNMSYHEEISKFTNIPDKVIVEENDFITTQKNEFDKLKKESKNEDF